MRRSPKLPAGLLAVLGLLAACGVSEREAIEPRVSSAPPPREALAPLPAAAPGALSIEVSGERLDVRALEVPRLELLRALEAALGFELVLTGVPAKLQNAPVTLTALDAALPEVLPLALGELAFELHYAVDAEGSGHHLAGLRVGRVDSDRGARGRGPSELARRNERRARAFDPPSRAERARRAAERARRAPVRLESADPEERAQGARDLPLDAAGLTALSELIDRDPDPDVRAAAAERLGDDDSAAAVAGLTRALSDPDPQVILAALDALEFVDDPSTLPAIRGLFEHPNPEVVDAAIDARDFIELR